MIDYIMKNVYSYTKNLRLGLFLPEVISEVLRATTRPPGSVGTH